MPYDHKNTTPNGASAHLMRTVLENLNHRHFQDSCLVGSGGGAVGYAHLTSSQFVSFIVFFVSERPKFYVIQLGIILPATNNVYAFISICFLGILHMAPQLITCTTL